MLLNMVFTDLIGNNIAYLKYVISARQLRTKTHVRHVCEENVRGCQ